jgi:hypothetical protein
LVLLDLYPKVGKAEGCQFCFGVIAATGVDSGRGAVGSRRAIFGAVFGGQEAFCEEETSKTVCMCFIRSLHSLLLVAAFNP